MSEKKTVHIQVRIPAELRDQFHKINEDKLINSSALIRKWIEDYVKENQ